MQGGEHEGRVGGAAADLGDLREFAEILDLAAAPFREPPVVESVLRLDVGDETAAIGMGVLSVNGKQRPQF
ncbi:MAG: hypothetical protein P4M07_14885 [Xanthobacteraceae bacterium]|nr:hypothetical protein [Xanthobacteraceae bacterium]